MVICFGDSPEARDQELDVADRHVALVSVDGFSVSQFIPYHFNVSQSMPECGQAFVSIFHMDVIAKDRRLVQALNDLENGANVPFA